MKITIETRNFLLIISSSLLFTVVKLKNQSLGFI